MPRYFSEIKALVRLALPVSLAQLALSGMTATDVLIAGNAGTIELAGMNLGANAWGMIGYFFMGIGFSTQPLIGKLFGAKDDAKIKSQFHQSLWMAFFLGLIAILCAVFMSWALQQFDFEQAMLDIAAEYILVISLGALPLVLIPVLRGTLEAMNYTLVVFWIYLLAFLLNIPLDYVLVNGLYGFPKLGGVGCAWATALLLWVIFALNVLLLLLHKELKQRKLFKDFSMPNWKMILATLKLGVPIGLSVLIELSMFCGAGIMIAYIGSVEASAHAVAITVASLSFMLYMGLAQGVTIRASQFLGAGDTEAAWYAVKAGTWFNLAIATFICIIFLLFNRSLVSLFSSDEVVIGLAIVLVYYGAAFQIADSLQVALLSALRAYHDTATAPKYQLIAFWLVGIPAGVGLAFYEWWPGLAGPEGLWLGMVGSLFLVGALLIPRLFFVKNAADEGTLQYLN